MNRSPMVLVVTVMLLATVLPVRALTQAEGMTEWLVMLYQNADDAVLEGDIFTDLNEAELVGSSDAVTIVSQLDRYVEGFDGDGDWTTAKRFLVTADDDLAVLGSEEIEDLGEVDSGAPETLVDFATWAMTAFPAQRYALILSDHGAGWVGGWNDDAPDEGSSLTINEIDQAFAEILAETGVDAFEFVGFDACLMSQVEALVGIAPYARFAAASEEVEPAMGWAYAQFLGALVDDPSQTGDQLAATIVDSYIVADVQIQDDQARTDYLLEAYGSDEDPGPDQLGAIESQDVTLTAVDLAGLPGLMDALDAFAVALTDVDQDAVSAARTYAQSYESVFGEDDVPSPYLDLGNFAMLAAEFAASAELDDVVRALQEASAAAIIRETHGEGRPGSTGFSIFFPTPDVLEQVGTADSTWSYTAFASRFAGASLWDDFLLFHYTDQAIVPGSADPGLLDPETGPGVDLEQYAAPLLGDETDIAEPDVMVGLSMAPLEASADQIGAGEIVELSTRIAGADVGYIYIEASLFDADTDSYIVVDRDFVAADQTEELGGVAYPVWTDADLEQFTVEWEPLVYTLGDGYAEAFVLLDPAVYGAGDDDTEYDVRGVYTFADTGEERSAIMTFDATLAYRSLLTFTDHDETGAPRSMAPVAGDTFTVTEDRYELDEQGEWVINEYVGDTLTFDGQPFVVTPYDSDQGEYSLGLIVTDQLDNSIAEYATVNVTGG